MKLTALMTIYNEAEFVEYAIRACLLYVDNLVIVEGAYQETINTGRSPRSSDDTNEIVSRIMQEECNREENCKIYYIQANEKSDKDQRNVGLKIAKEIGTDWLLIIDGDEVYQQHTFKMIRNLARILEGTEIYCSYFTSITFVNDLNHYTNQEFPRLFKVTPGCYFVNDNYMTWIDNKGFTNPDTQRTIKTPNIKYHHYAFCKGTERFLSKKQWWETRFANKKFEYDWYVDENGKLYSPNHKIFKYTGRHPEVMKTHKLYKK